MDKVFYNQSSAANLGWKPDWFGENEFDDDLVLAIAAWQKKNGLKADGLCGPGTFRRIFTERQSEIDKYEPDLIKDKDESFIVHQGNFFPIDWPKVVLWSEEKGYKARKGYTSYFEPRDIKMFVNHWDVCLNSRSCYKVLDKRGLAVHFLIDNDGTIFQLLDMNHAAYHAGSKKHNHSTVGVEISNAYDPKYQSWYEKNGFGSRPIMEGQEVHGKALGDFTGFYDIQLQALKALWKAVHEATGIPMKCPLDKNGNTLKKVSTSAAANSYKGFVSHYHLTSRKIDCAGLDISGLLKEIK
tara:strand:- start:1928 stop:2821 length:894 start_codon:yes stop_codon:yes gene_type:complete